MVALQQKNYMLIKEESCFEARWLQFALVDKAEMGNAFCVDNIKDILIWFDFTLEPKASASNRANLTVVLSCCQI